MMCRVRSIFEVLAVTLAIRLLALAWCVTASAESEQISQLIDRRLAEDWKASGMRPADTAPDGIWCRRVYVDVIGRIPSVEELDDFLEDQHRDKRDRLLDRLLTDERYTAEYARHWSTIWSNLLIGRLAGGNNNSLTSREGMRSYLHRVFADNVPYDEMVHELITATGTTDPDSSQFNGATNFLVMKLQDRAVQATARTAQLFLGTQIQCTQCHHHPFNHWKQSQFWEFNSFFRQAVALRRFQTGTRRVREVELTDQDFAGEGNHPSAAEVYYERRNGVLRVAYPAFLDGQSLSDRSGYIADVNRRQELGRLIRESPKLARTMVNRLWQHFLGYGLTTPVDDMGPHRPVRYPDLLDQMAQAFRQQNFDTKQLIRWIAGSRAYRLSSQQTSGNEMDAPEQGTSPEFSRFYARQMSAEQLYGSLLMATGAARTQQDPERQAALKAKWLRQFSTAFGTDEGDESSTFNGTIPQALMMFNGDLTERAISLAGGNYLSGVVQSSDPLTTKLDQLFLTALARRPTGKERRMAVRLIANHQRAGNDPAAGLQDLWWALLNSSEFILNH